ncbi:MAG: PrsW family intramembrane metalloprotease [Lachnospiraceae bacterium]|nr:PrsW family intramembrane metalloprotease [Lachnospiraceae bacterium]
MGNTEFFRQTADLKTNFKWREIFSEMFKNHTDEQKEKILVSGCKEFMPSEARMLKEWQRPYMFFRFGVCVLIFVLILRVVCIKYPAPTFLALLLTVPACIGPMTILIFMWEMNVPKNISILELIKYVLYSGVIGGVITFVLRDLIGIADNAPANIGGPLPEEIAKFIIVYLIIRKINCKYILNGLLIGCAVGAGFAAEESMGYAFSQLIDYGIDAMHDINFLRGWSSMGGHSVWSAMYGAALVYAKKDEPLKISHIANKTVIIYWIIPLVLHFIWNTPIGAYMGGNSDMVEFAKMIILIIIAWIIIFKLLRKGLVQVIKVSDKAAAERASYEALQMPTGNVAFAGGATMPVGAMSRRVIVNCVRGALMGRSFELNQKGGLLIGRDASAGAMYPQNTRGISGRHCEIMSSGGKIVIVDRGSTYGTYLADGRKLEPNVPYDVKNGTVFYLASRENKFEIRM